MDDAADLTNVVRLLEAAGLRVERVPEAQTKRCDLRAEDSHERYLVEVKGFHDDEAINKTLRKGNRHESVRSFEASDIIDAAIREAVQQIQETLDRRAPELRIVCLLSRNEYDPEVASQRILSALYGMRSLVTHKATGAPEHLQCLYFGESAFFRHRHDLDAAIIIDADDGITFCINDHARSIHRVRTSELARFFGRASYEAGTWERQGWLVADCPFDRRTEVQQVLRYVEQKYGLAGTLRMEFHRFRFLA